MLVFDYDTLELARTYFMKLIVVCIGKAELVTGMMLKAIPSSYFIVVLRSPPASYSLTKSPVLKPALGLIF